MGAGSVNISLSDNYPTGPGGQPETLADRLAEHQSIITAAGYMITGNPVLVPETDEDAYPGSYQVWNPITDGEGTKTWWLYIDPEGVAFEVECPTACDRVKVDQ